MKKIFTHLFALFLLSLVATSNVWAQETTEISLNFSEGTCNSTSGEYCSSWSSATNPVVTISVVGGNNNLVVSPASGSFEMHEGSSGSDWKISVDGYEILSYSFMYKTKETGNNVTITANGTIYTSSDEEQELRVTGLTSSEVSFNLAGNNNGIIVTDFVLEVQPLALITLEAGKVYNFKSVGYSGKSMASIDLDRTAIADTDLEDYTQLWYVDNGTVEGTYTLRNLANGLYLQGAGSGTKWPFVENPSNLYYLAVGLGFSMTANSGQNPTQQYWMHYGSGNGCVVGWDANAGATQWIVEEVEFSDEDLLANWNEIASINGVNESVVAEYQSYLEALFNDKACTVPAKAYTTVDELNADNNYNNLPDGLKAMVRKVYFDEWDEANIDSSKEAWGSSADGSKHYAKRFRVQQYEPYSYGEKTHNMLGIYQHTNMNNPTGLVANFRDVIYVMVEGEINEETGASLYIQGHVGDGAMGAVGGTKLKEGLNVIPFWGDGYQLFIHYVIDTYNDGALTGHTLSENAPLKIHIEGGHINGFFDTVGDDVNQADTDADWQYYEERATQSMFAVLGQYVMFYMNLYDKYGYGLKNHFGTGADDVSVAEVMHVWETIDVAQRMTEGLLSEEETNKWSHGKIAYNGRDKLYPSDYSEVFNNRSLAWSSPDGYFMFASSWYTHYQSNNFASIIGRIHIDGDNWGPAHEIGHTHQGPINLPSASETSNNLLANISNWYCGRTTSRLSTLSDALANFNANESFLAEASGGVWTKLQMYTKLWFYYHLAEKNTSFYPRFFELMRRDGIRREQGVALTGSETMLKFYKNACIAAEEDLTDFFAAYGFFVPCEGTFSDDYGHFKTVMTQAEIDAVKAEVAALAEENGWVKNNTILFIDDRIGETYSCLDGTTVLQPRGDGASSGLGELGSVNDYDNNPDNDVAPLTGTYSYSISGSTITMMDATGGVGFAIYDADGNLVGFSNTYSFELSEAAQAAIASGTAKVCVVKADNTTESIADINPAQTQASLLKEFLPVVEELLQYSDATETKVGWYKEKELTKLLAAYNNAKSVYDEGNLAAYAGAYTVLYDEYINVKNSATAKIEFVDNRTYYLKNVSTQKYMTVDSDGNVVTTSTVPTTEETASLWQLNAGNYDTFYSLKNQSAGKYIRYPQKEGNDYVNGQQFVLTTDLTTFVVEEFSIGKFTIKDLGSQKYFNDYGGSGNVKTYGSIDDGSKWEIVYLPIDETMEERAKLEDQILLTQVLIDEVGYANYEQLVLQKDPNQANYLYCNAPHSTDDGNGVDGDYVKNLTDGNTGSYLHTVWSGNSADGENHYLRVDLGSGNELDIIRFVYATRNSSNLDMPSKMLVQGSNSETTGYETLATLTKDDTTNPLPTAASVISWYRSSKITSGTPYRYYRFMVEETERELEDGNGHYAFTMSEFQLYKPVLWLNDEYNTDENLALLNATFNELTESRELLLKTATAEELQTAYNELYAAYEDLLTAKESVDASSLDLEKQKLQTLINSANELIAQCKEGEITKVDATESSVALQSTDESAANHLYCNAPLTSDGGASASNGYNLLDNDASTYLHTNNNNYDGEDNYGYHYLRVDLGEGNSTAYFKFGYQNRNPSSFKVFPKILDIQGSNDNVNYESIVTLSSGLPDGIGGIYGPSSVLGNGKKYRYFRFVVKSTHYGGGEPDYFCMAEFDFWTATIDDYSVTLSATCGKATEEMVLDAYRAVQSASKAIDIATTEEQLQTAYSVLEAAYKVLEEAAKNNVDKSELEELIAATTILKNRMYEIESYTPNEVTLSITEGEAGYLYCNAPETNSGSSTDNAGVAALIDLTEGGDPDLTTYLHTEYGSDQSADSLDHYLRVDLGEVGATYVEFGYVGRSDHESKSPETVVVEATNDLNGEWTTIKTLNMAQPNATTETKTGAVGNGVAYRYWRFMVKDTHFNGQDRNGHKYFALSDFNVYRCTDVVISSQLKSEYNPNIHIYTTAGLVAEVEAALVTANGVVDDAEVLQPAVDAAVVALQPVYDKLAHAVEYYWCPVKLTTDVDNPELYTINAPGRGDSKAWQYNAQNNNITIVDKDASNLYHLWYFMLGGEEQTVKIIPVMTPEYGLSATDFTNGSNKVSAVAENCVNWSFAYVNNYYNFKPHGRNIYLSNIYGGSNPLGFYGSAEGGSYVNFTAVEVEDYTKARLAKLAEGKSAVTAGTTFGTYSENSANEYNTALDAANNMAETSTPQDYIDAFTRLFNASNGLVINMPQSDKFYVLRCNHENRYIYVNAENKLQWAASSYDKALSNAVWVFEDVDASAATCKMKSLHTQSYLSGLSGSQWVFGETGKVVTLAKSPSVDGAVIFKIEGNGDNGLHAHGENNTVISYTNDAGANHYFFEEVEDVTTIKHTVTMSAVFSSVMLGYNAKVPAGVKAYNAIGIDGGYVSLGEVAVPGETLPAGTPVILYRTDDATSKVFTYSEETPVSVDGESLLGGSLFVKYVACEDGKDYYKLMLKDGEAKMYWMYKEFNANGESTDSDDKNAGGHIKCSANKIYMALPNSGSNPVTMYGMRFIDDSATGIEEMKGENGEVKAIYDLQGRKLTEITEPGMYIVDGKKVYVK